MHSIKMLVLGTLALASAAMASDANLELMVYSDGPKLRRDEAWPEKSAVYAAAKKELRLSGARNEVLGFQIFLRSKEGSIGGVNIQAADLAGAGSGKPALEAKNLEFFRAWFTKVETPSETNGKVHGRGVGEYPDPLVPLQAKKFGAPFDLAPGQTEILFGDLYIPHGTPAGEYRGVLTLSSGGKELEKLDLTLTVWNFTLPEESHFKSTCYYETEFVRWGFRNPSPEDALKIEENFFKLAQRHRMNCPSDVTLRASETDWEKWAERYGKYLDGSAFTASPGKGQPQYLWRTGMDVNAGEAEWKARLKVAADYFQKKGWLDRFVISGFDEPKPAQYPLVKRIAQFTREASNGRIKFFLPGASPNPEYQDFVDIWDGCWTEKDLPALEERRKAGQRVWYAGSFGAPANPCMDDLPYGNRAWPWVGWRFNFEGFEMWHAVYWTDKFNLPKEQRAEMDRNPEKYLNVWKNPTSLTFDEGRKRGGKRWKEDILQNGSTSLFYPGYDAGLPLECVASLKAKDFRRGAQDYEYLWLLKKAGEQKLVDAGLAKVLTAEGKGLTLDEQVWEDVRKMLGEKLDKIGDIK
ncbi:MAG: DUF4091 domain-containing protein [Planctomycetes bacterium]|nr:DUF4091 domain-containing protein [Planctomycetota bacterium]